MSDQLGHDGAADARTWIAIVLAWAVPGLGHCVLGRYRRGALFALVVWSALGLGLAHDGRLALRDERQPLLTTLQIIANAGVGPVDLIARAVVYGDAFSYRLPNDRASAKERQTAAKFRERARQAGSIYGTAYLWTAGLMNLLLLFDVWDIARGRRG